jgi:hypothetical protein
MAEKAQTLSLKRFIGGGLLFVALFASTPVHAASQYFSPSGGSYKAHSTFAVSVYAESLDQPASAFSANIHFPPDKLQVVALAKGESIISIWVQEPSYANDTGTIRFEGLIPNPGYTGAGGKLLTITFEAVGDAPVELTFADGVILANDGYGTDITAGLGAAAFTLVAADDTQLIDDTAPQGDGQPVKVDQGPHRPAGTVEGIQTAIVSAFDGSSGESGQASWLDGLMGTGPVTLFTQLLQIAILCLLALLILAALIATCLYILRFSHHQARTAIRGLSDQKARRIRTVLSRLDRDIHHNLRRLEKVSRTRDLPPEIDKTILSVSRALVDLEDDIAVSLKDF